MDLKSELLKSIWYAFTSLEAERSGKVSKSQLKVLSHNLYTALNIPHDPVALEEHFKDNDNGPVSDHGYMPYLNKYILAKAIEGTFNKEIFDELCWTMTAKKNLKPSIQQGVCSQSDCFKLFCLFNLLSEDHYPLVIVQPEVEYLLKKISTAMSQEWDGKALEYLLSQDPSLQDGLSVWMFLEHLSAGHLMRVDSKEAFSLALDDLFMEMYHNVLKKGYMLKKGNVRRNWNGRWFVLKPGSLAYYISEDQKEKKGEVQLDGSCVVEVSSVVVHWLCSIAITFFYNLFIVLKKNSITNDGPNDGYVDGSFNCLSLVSTMPDKEGRRCLFCVKTPGRTYEMSASDQKQRVEWIQALQTALRLKTEGKSSLHQELKLRRRELREYSQRNESQSSQSGQRSNSQSNQGEHSAEVEEPSSVTQHGEPESKEPDLEIIDIIQQHLELEVQRKKEDEWEKEKQKERQQELERQLEEANKAREDMETALAKMEREVQQQKKRLQELELMQQKLEEALNTQIQARLEEEKVRHELERLLEEERGKLTELMLHQRHLESHECAETTQEKTLEPQKDEDNILHPASSVIPPSSSPQLPLCPAHAIAETVETHQYNVENVSENFSKAQNIRQWNVQLNRLMKPITPADKLERFPVRTNYPKHGQALTSTEFIVKYQSTVTEAESSNSQPRKTEEDVGIQEPIPASRVEEPQKTREQFEHSKGFA
ncbi:differentially expressed in FDCP 6 homolog isoform X2 [Ictalurus furcatus]|uniref:differentially expressed in FDCP 6 homolog isoform X2 n=1 Tax=Ictalurus furcatus TaxID=66913 RepID=UPI00234FCC8E|nr:differentially expressed in FDCP 6 homolog isoform X2 [Ictalurus furcatus]